MAVFETVLRSDLKKPIRVVQLTGNLFSADNGGNKITVEVVDNGSPASISGGVTGYVIREDNSTVVIIGSLSSNMASIVLPASAYAVVGKVSIVVKVGETTVGACTAYVYRTTTDTIVDPGSVIPDISELLALIGECEDAATAASTAATEASRVNASLSKNNGVVTIVITNRNNQQTTVTMNDYEAATISETQAIITEFAG